MGSYFRDTESWFCLISSLLSFIQAARAPRVASASNNKLSINSMSPETPGRVTFIFGGSLESPCHFSGCFWFFCPKILGGGRDLPIVVLLEKECSFSGADNVR